MNLQSHRDHMLDAAERVLEKREQREQKHRRRYPEASRKTRRERRERVRTLAAVLQVCVTLSILAVNIYLLWSR